MQTEDIIVIQTVRNMDLKQGNIIITIIGNRIMENGISMTKMERNRQAGRLLMVLGTIFIVMAKWQLIQRLTVIHLEQTVQCNKLKQCKRVGNKTVLYGTTTMKTA